MIWIIAPSQLVGENVVNVDFRVRTRGKDREATIITRPEQLLGRIIYEDDEVRWIDSPLWERISPEHIERLEAYIKVATRKENRGTR